MIDTLFLVAVQSLKCASLLQYCLAGVCLCYSTVSEVRAFVAVRSLKCVCICIALHREMCRHMTMRSTEAMRSMCDYSAVSEAWALEELCTERCIIDEDEIEHEICTKCVVTCRVVTFFDTCALAEVSAEQWIANSGRHWLGWSEYSSFLACWGSGKWGEAFCLCWIGFLPVPKWLWIL